MPDIPVPADIVSWMHHRSWGSHHLQWHVERLWDALSPEVIAWATSQGWKRYPVPEGGEGNGLAFLAMHRVMISQLVSAFPQHKALFTGWPQPPTDPKDPNDPVPGEDDPPLSSDMLAAIDRLHTNLTIFDGEDELGRFIETSFRPFPNEPRRRSTDRSCGIHNYLHNRFMDQSSPIDIGDPAVNIENSQFWRLHGWIDARWSAYRTATGRSDTDAAYLKLLEQAAMHMEPGHGGHRPMAETLRRPERPTIPEKVKKDILATLASRVAQ